MTPKNLKVFLDTSVIFAGILSPSGGSRKLLPLGEIGLLQLVGPDGKFLPAVNDAELEGKNIFDCNPLVVEKVRRIGALLHEETLTHSYPHCWRTKTPILFRATEQWFITMDSELAGKGRSLRELGLEGVEQTQWVPAQGQNRIQAMIAGRPDWCISRQRSWGVPLPFFLHKATGELHPDTMALIDRAAAIVAEGGVEARWRRHRAMLDVMDLWFNEPEFHGCMFMNAAAEFPNPNDPVHRAAARYLRRNRDHRRDLARSAGAEASAADLSKRCRGSRDAFMGALLQEGLQVLPELAARAKGPDEADHRVRDLLQQAVDGRSVVVGGPHLDIRQGESVSGIGEQLAGSSREKGAGVPGIEVGGAGKPHRVRLNQVIVVEVYLVGRFRAGVGSKLRKQAVVGVPVIGVHVGGNGAKPVHKIGRGPGRVLRQEA